MAKTRGARKVANHLTLEEYLGLGSICLFLLFLLYWIYRRSTAASRKYKQTNPYVATVDLQERYGGLEKRAVSINDLSTEQLILLRRDGKLTTATIQKLIGEGKLPGESSSSTSSAVVTSKPRVAAVTRPPVSVEKKMEAPVTLDAKPSAPSSETKKRKGKSKGKKK